MTSKTLIRGGSVVSMDPDIGDLTGDVLIEDDKIVAVEPNISADAEVIDASDSMKGQPIASAVEAARAFAARRLPTQRVGIVLFNGTTKTILPLTSDGDAISSALAEPPPLAHGTHIYDGVATAVGMLEAAHVAAGSIVVLSDGADTGSNVSLESVAAESRGSHIRIYSVGLRNKAFQPGPLQDLAEGAGGTFTGGGVGAFGITGATAAMAGGGATTFDGELGVPSMRSTSARDDSSNFKNSRPMPCGPAGSFAGRRARRCLRT